MRKKVLLQFEFSSRISKLKNLSKLNEISRLKQIFDFPIFEFSKISFEFLLKQNLRKDLRICIEKVLRLIEVLSVLSYIYFIFCDISSENRFYRICPLVLKSFFRPFGAIWREGLDLSTLDKQICA